MKGRARNGFTLLELMLSISILSVVSVLTYLAISTVTDAWRRGMRLTETLHNGDFVIEQIAMAMRSAYYHETTDGTSQYGFWQEDNGEGETDADVISWAKLGGALVGKEMAYAGSPHRVKLTIEDDEDGRPAVSVRSWRVKGQDEDFDPDELDPVFLSTRIQGMNCRTAFESEDGELDWLDEWEETNRLPRQVEITLYVAPLEEGDRPVEVKRLVSIPAAELSWAQK